MTKEELTAKYVGRTGLLDMGALIVRVTVTGVRANYGRIDLLVTPKDGTGTAWVKEMNVTLDEKWPE